MRPLCWWLQPVTNQQTIFHILHHQCKTNYTFWRRLRIKTMSEQKYCRLLPSLKQSRRMWRTLYFQINLFVCNWIKNNLPNWWLNRGWLEVSAEMTLPVWEGKGRRTVDGTLYITGKTANQTSSLWRNLNRPPMTVSISDDAYSRQPYFLFRYLYFIMSLNGRMALDVSFVWR